MRWCSSLLLGVAALAAGETAPPATPAPWTGTFTMKLRGNDRVFVRFQERAWLRTTSDDFAAPESLPRGELAVAAKLRRAEGGTAQLWVPMVLAAAGDPALWAGRVEGDNLYVFGLIDRGTDGKPLLRASFVAPAPSDAETVALRVADIAATDSERRLEAAAWARAEAARQANREWWLEAADRLVIELAEALAAAAEPKRDVAQVQRAMDLVIKELKDERRAAKLGSAAWIRAAAGPAAEQVAARLRRLGMEFYADAWRPRAEALAMEFEDRYDALSFRDAEGYYRLGRWVDERAELLPQAKDLAHRAFTTGLRADPDHPGIRRELGLAPTSRNGGALVDGDGEPAAAALQRDGVVVPPPNGWARGGGDDAEITWVDPTTPASTISVAVLSEDFDTAWSSAYGALAGQADFTIVRDDTTTPAADITQRQLDFNAASSEGARPGTLILIGRSGGSRTVRLIARARPEEIDAVRGLLGETAGGTCIGEPPAPAPPAEPPPTP